MTKRVPPGLLDAVDGCDPTLRRLLDSAKRELPDPARTARLVERIQRAAAGEPLDAGDSDARPTATREPAPRRWEWRSFRGWFIVSGSVLLAAAWFMLYDWRSQQGRSAASPDAQAPSAADGRPQHDPLPGGVVRQPSAARERELGDAAGTSGTAPDSAVTPGVVEGAPRQLQGALADAARATADRDIAAADSGAAKPRPDARPSASGAGPAPSRRSRTSAARERLDEPGALSPPLPAVSGSAARSPAPAQTQLEPELQLLAAAQRTLRAAPRRALALAERHARGYPQGQFVQEREEIAITALFALGDLSAARARARAFILHYPRSVQATRITALLEHP